MPWSPKRPCLHPGCSNLTDSGRCPEHVKQERREYDAARKDDPYRKIYSSKRWRAVRALQLEREPICRECAKERRVTAATIVDHIVPMKQGGAAWDESNFQSLCAAHHSAKSIREGSRYGGADEREDEPQSYVIA